jgi:hypothetical protein
LALLYQKLVLTMVNPSKTSFSWVSEPCQQEKASVKWQIVLGSEAAVKHTYFLFHKIFYGKLC